MPTSEQNEDLRVHDNEFDDFHLPRGSLSVCVRWLPVCVVCSLPTSPHTQDVNHSTLCGDAFAAILSRIVESEMRNAQTTEEREREEKIRK